MTLAEIANFCAETLGMPETQTIAQAKKFAQARWKMIWDFADWKQAHHEVIAPVPAATEEVELPVEVELVKAVRIGGNRELLPSSQITQIGIDPAGFGNSGPTYAFSPVARSDAGAVRIRLHRPLSEEQELLFLCKRKCAELAADTDKPLIPGVDQCLIAFTLGDLYRWQRQHTKAAELYQEAQAHLQQMVRLETIQTAQTVRFVPFTEPGGYSSDVDWLVGK
jgi:hypothetical protein